METEAWEGDSSKVDELTRENELLLLQLHQVQEELKYYYLKYQEIAGGRQGANSIEISMDDKLGNKNFSTTVLDLRQFIDGENWYSAEHDGRWAGPGTISTLRLPALQKGHYKLELEIVDAIEPEILREMNLSLNGKLLVLKGRNGLIGPWAPFVGLYRKRQKYPLLLRSEIHITDAEVGADLYLEFGFPKTISAVERGAQDARDLAIRLKMVTIISGN